MTAEELIFTNRFQISDAYEPHNVVIDEHVAKMAIDIDQKEEKRKARTASANLFLC